MSVVTLMCQSVYLSWKMAVQNAGCTFAYFCGGTKTIFGYNFVAPLRYWGKTYTLWQFFY